MTKRLKIAFHTLGCKLNFSETSTIKRDFANDDKFTHVDFTDQADFYVINSCSVTNNAEKKCRELINRAKRQNPKGKIAVIGCFSQLKHEQLSKMDKVDIVLGNKEKFELFDYIDKYRRDGIIPKSGKISKLNQFISSCSSGDRTRTFFKIQDGCDYKCTYCIVPMARGRSRSDNIEGTLLKIKKITQKKVKELVLTGVNIGDFGKSHNENFFELLKEIDKIDNIERIRLSSIEPDLLENEIIELVADSKKIMPHFHIPLQSGSDKVLKEMKRNYDTKLFASKVEKIKKMMPLACVAVDVIAGFPAETREDFYATKWFIENLPVSYLHVFTYSERENTPASKFINKVCLEQKKLRSIELKKLSKDKLIAFYDINKGEKTDVLFEQKTKNGFISGFTPNYVRVKTPYEPAIENVIKKVYLVDYKKEDMQFECNFI